MKKVININFQGRVIPIEETAYEILKQYVESLRRYFSREEGRDEIINDIENRVAELFEERLKKGAVCITDEDVEAVMVSMGRPEDFEEQDGADRSESSYTHAHAGSGQQHASAGATAEEPRRLRRAENDTVLGGVCAGIAHYLRIDPAVVRIIFALIAFAGFGFGFLLYIILWIVLPAAPLQTNVRKRLYRDPENKVIGGVAGGLAAYFNVDTWIPRLIFLVPFIVSVVPNLFGNWNFWWGPKLAFGGLGGTFFITYIILWIVLPQAVTATEKLEMRGEKIDLESIKNTVQGEMQGIKSKAEKAGKDLSAKATAVGEEIGKVATERSEEFSRMANEKSRAFAAEVRPVAKKVGTGIGNAIGVIFKAFFLFIAAIIAFALMMVLVALMYSGVGISLLQNFLLEGFWQNFLAWSVIILFIGVPVIALLVWVARRIMRVKSHNPYLGYTFGSLWIIGLISVFILMGTVSRNFLELDAVGEEAAIEQPASNSMVIKLSDTKRRYYSSDVFGNQYRFLSRNGDSLLLNTVRVRLVRSEDSAYHINIEKRARGNTLDKAAESAGNIQFAVDQNDSLILLPNWFMVSKENKFRNQQVVVNVAVPVGKKVMIDRSVNRYDWFNLNVSRGRGINVNWDEHWGSAYSWRTNVPYIMTESGLERLDRKNEEPTQQLKNGKFRLKADEHGVEIEAEGELENGGGKYRYRQQKKQDSIKTEKPAVQSNAPVTSKKGRGEATTSKKDRIVKTEPGFHNPLIFFLGKIR